MAGAVDPTGAVNARPGARAGWPRETQLSRRVCGHEQYFAATPGKLTPPKAAVRDRQQWVDSRRSMWPLLIMLVDEMARRTACGE
jgi:hypothetical protein